jgi:type II secretion system protein J
MTRASTYRRPGYGGFTLIEVLTAVAILSVLGLMSYRGLHAVLDVQEHVARETEKWRSVSAFVARFERDVQLAAERPVRTAATRLPAFVADERGTLEFSRAASSEFDTPRRVAYSYDGNGAVALMLWPGLDTATQAPLERHRVLTDVSRLELHYLGADLAWTSAWPARADSPALPLAVRLRIVLSGGEEIVRVFALKS